jgi:hypothetical protein
MQDLDHGLPFLSVKGLWRLRSNCSAVLGLLVVCIVVPVKCGSGYLQRLTGRLFTDIMAQREDRIHQLLLSLSSGFWLIPRISEIFF